ncbi:hypothetical protein B5M09_001512 [Aphanomyces astaci]|uniref:Uncharacterized protein n=1 Tax=Aphanomyces astaci TaxID=112090 RepID=A0A425CXH9_APHAT|nr:hypothetical protein B5M09_001512 [Aphanomyces astaci]
MGFSFGSPKKPTSGLFNVGDSLNAIEEWTERITRSEKEEGAPLAVAPVQERCRTPKQHHHQTPHQQQNLSKSSHKPSHSSSKGGRGSVEEASNSTSRGPNVARTGGPAVLMIKREELPVDFSSSRSNHVAETNTYRGLADDDLVLVLQGKDKRYASQLKTKDSFRSFFQGIAAQHLETLLRRAYGDNTDKAHRRMQLMEGWMAVA